METKEIKCDCCDWFGQEPSGEIRYCSVCEKYFCEGCWASTRRMEYFVKYWWDKIANLPTPPLVYDKEEGIPAKLQKYADKFLIQ